jgi:hypothetical protein
LSAIAIGVIVIVVLIIISLVAIFGFGLLQRETADFRGDVEAVERTTGSGAFRIAAYEQFFNLCAAVQTHEARIANLERELERNPSDSRVEQIEASITAVRNQRMEAINRYNADARMDYTRGQFQDSELPFQLDPNAEETSCDA